MPQQSLGDFGAGSSEPRRTDSGKYYLPDECPHPPDEVHVYVVLGKHLKGGGHRERRAYCNACARVIEQKRIPLN